MNVVLMVLMVGFTLPEQSFQPVHISTFYMPREECAAESVRRSSETVQVTCQELQGELPEKYAHLVRGHSSIKN